MNRGQKWTHEEENQLLEELKCDTNTMEDIAQIHGRTISGIETRRMYMAWQMHQQGVSVNEIAAKLVLFVDDVKRHIEQKKAEQAGTSVSHGHSSSSSSSSAPAKKTSSAPPKAEPKPATATDVAVLRQEVANVASNVRKLQTTLDELVAMMKAVYEFEDA